MQSPLSYAHLTVVSSFSTKGFDIHVTSPLIQLSCLLSNTVMTPVRPCRSADVPWFPPGFVHGSVLRQRRWPRQGSADACPLWLQRPELCHHLLPSGHSDSPGWAVHLCVSIFFKYTHTHTHLWMCIHAWCVCFSGWSCICRQERKHEPCCNLLFRRGSSQRRGRTRRLQLLCHPRVPTDILLS